jgi:predicted RNase H-like nuclease
MRGVKKENRIRIAGVDLAWGERRPDGFCVLEANRQCARVLALGLSRGDDELLALLDEYLKDAPAFIAMDAPIVCPNLTGARPVDRLTHVHFGRFKSGAHPANLTRCRRPPRVAAKLVARGFTLGVSGARVLAEVYPHPAMVRLFGLSERIAYKRGRVEMRRREFRRLQKELRVGLATHFPALEVSAELSRLLRAPWTKNVEDQTDAFFCALIGYWHWLHRGRRTQMLGDLVTGFILVPQP